MNDCKLPKFQLQDAVSVAYKLLRTYDEYCKEYSHNPKIIAMCEWLHVFSDRHQEFMQNLIQHNYEEVIHQQVLKVSIVHSVA